MHRQSVHIAPENLQRALDRAGLGIAQVEKKGLPVSDWMKGTKQPTVKQLEEFAKKVHLPFGYLFTENLPESTPPFPFFRAEDKGPTKEVSLSVYETILILQQRQAWLREHRIDNNHPSLDFVGCCRHNKKVEEIVTHIRKTLGLDPDWASNCKNWKEALDKLISVIEDCDIIVSFNGVVGNNTKRPIPVDECRGFVLVDKYAPFMFINNRDAKAAQIFTIAHELAHIWTGHSAGFDFRKLQPTTDPIEVLCNKVAAELLVPEEAFKDAWKQHPDDYERLSKNFKVSRFVIARRALDTQKISQNEYEKLYTRWMEEFRNKPQGSGGDFYLTSPKRLSRRFLSHIKYAVEADQLLHMEAYTLTGVKGDTFEELLKSG